MFGQGYTQGRQEKPRKVVIGKDIPKMGRPALLPAGTPERKLVEYLDYWKHRNYGYMARCLSPMLGPSVKAAPLEVRQMFSSRSLLSFRLTRVEDVAPAVTEIETELSYEDGGEPVNKIVKFRLVCADSKGGPATRGDPGSNWSIINWGVW